MNTGLSSIVVPFCFVAPWGVCLPPQVCLHHIPILGISGEEKGRLGFFTTTLGGF